MRVNSATQACLRKRRELSWADCSCKKVGQTHFGPTPEMVHLGCGMAQLSVIKLIAETQRCVGWFGMAQGAKTPNVLVWCSGLTYTESPPPGPACLFQIVFVSSCVQIFCKTKVMWSEIFFLSLQNCAWTLCVDVTFKVIVFKKLL